jgi:hypothetical protein
MDMRALVTWVVLVGIASMVMLAMEMVLLRGVDQSIAAPVSQAVGLFAAWALAWPLWYKDQPRKPGYTFLTHAGVMLFVVFLIAAVRIKLGIG